MKNLFFPAMFFAVATMVGCSENEPNMEAATTATTAADLLSINVYAGTTKGTDATTTTLETSAWVELHIDDSDGVSDTYTFTYDGSDWSQTDTAQLTWSSITFPANFYSLHDGAPLTGLVFDDDIDDDYATYTNYTVSGASTSHMDLVYHASQLNTIPTGGAVNAYHKHALSKIHLYAATGSNNVYIARVNMVNIDSVGTVTIKPLSADEISTSNGVSWKVTTGNYATYLYHYIGDYAASALNSTENGSDPLINTATNAPLMIIPQTTTAATISEDIDGGGDEAIVSYSYIEVIYYMTDSCDMPVVGFSAVSARPDASEYITDDQGKTLYVMGGFPLGYKFEANKVYDITLGIGADGSTGGQLLADYYVDKDGNAVTLTKKGTDCDDDGDSDEDDGTKVEIPEIDEGDDILGGSDDLIDIVVTVHNWVDGDSIQVEYSDTDTDTE